MKLIFVALILLYQSYFEMAQTISKFELVNADATTKEHSEQSGRMRHLAVKSVLFAGNTFGQDIPVKFEINNLRNSDGNIIVSVYNSPKSFDDGIPWKSKIIPKKGNMDGGIFKSQFSLPPGVYGLVFVDDENKDGEMTNRLIGIPKEGFGFSNFYLSGFKKPKFPDFSFLLSDNMETINVRLRYM